MIKEKVKGLTVTLSHDIAIEDIEVLINTIKMFKGIVSVDMSMYIHPDDYFNRQRIKWELRDKFFDFYNETFNK